MLIVSPMDYGPVDPRPSSGISSYETTVNRLTSLVIHLEFTFKDYAVSVVKQGHHLVPERDMASDILF